MTVAVVVAVDPELAGQLMAGFLLLFVIAGCTLGFGRGGNVLRVTVIVLASIQGLCGLGATAAQLPPGLLGTIVGITIVILLSQKSSGAWFKRPR
ncbi:hypothetical protein [Nocardia bhagyanarayanae]|uniref:hypothetical protein n=1 Tax=Nocardia bhagyanarayanae TaxID=1215925 RepID=UPI001FEAC995|nr:hypothetical protein [Nocardia bhagyanarayanae]